MTGIDERRHAARDFGLWAEAVALILLTLRGYRILARRYRAAGGEIDLVAARGKTIAFVEVKARKEMGAARSAIDEEKRLRVSSAVRHWIGRHPSAVDFAWRGDAVFVAPRQMPVHLPDAFALDLDAVSRL